MKTKNFLILILALILVSFFAGHMITFKKRNAAYGQVMALTDSISAYTVVIDDLETRVFEKQQVIGTMEQAIAAGILEEDRLKALNMKHLSQISKLEGELKAAIDSIPLPDSIFVTDTIETGPGEGKTYAILPFSWEYKDQYLGLKTGIHEDKTAWFDLEAQVSLYITLGDIKKKPVAAVTTPSPYVTITDFNVVNIQEQTLLYKHPWIPWAGGFVGGVASGWLIWGR